MLVPATQKLVATKLLINTDEEDLLIKILQAIQSTNLYFLDLQKH